MSPLWWLLACMTPADTEPSEVESVTESSSSETDDTELTAAGCIDEPAPTWDSEMCLTGSPCAWTGEHNSSYWGWSLSAGDLDGDGMADLAVGGPALDVEGTEEVDSAGGVSIYLHDALAASSPPAAVSITGTEAQQWVGHSVLVLGDRNGDGAGELVIGARGDDRGETNAGAVYLFAGGAVASGTVDDAGVIITGSAPYARLGQVIAAGGDLDGDGLAELLLADDLARWNEEDKDEEHSTGVVRILFGGADGGTLASTDLPGLAGEGDDDLAGYAMAAGDLDGDGRDDLTASAPQSELDMGRVFAVPGTAELDGSLADAPVQLEGHARYDGFGSALAIGDVDGDGASELLVGSPGHDDPWPSAGRVDLYAGGSSFFSSANPEPIATFTGEFDHHDLGSSVSLGDLDGDGLAELIMAAEDANTHLLTKSGRVYVYGGGAPSSGDVGEADAIIRGSEVKDYLGRGQALADMDGDGLLDLWLGSGYHDGSGVDRGVVALFRGAAR